jgi:hypothetical protein
MSEQEHYGHPGGEQYGAPIGGEAAMLVAEENQEADYGVMKDIGTLYQLFLSWHLLILFRKRHETHREGYQ